MDPFTAAVIGLVVLIAFLANLLILHQVRAELIAAIQQRAHHFHNHSPAHIYGLDTRIDARTFGYVDSAIARRISARDPWFEHAATMVTEKVLDERADAQAAADARKAEEAAEREERRRAVSGILMDTIPCGDGYGEGETEFAVEFDESIIKATDRIVEALA